MLQQQQHLAGKHAAKSSSFWQSESVADAVILKGWKQEDKTLAMAMDQ
jgi:hypothetical protein